ncbi:hypothetical protein EVG20_g4124 [Dentipellis fragilis]|uniref:DNA 3'-5' helicase n=1 Tax=Dentipellis fragilis TaxID=205917 RepID=A0A4Y9YYY4_9AGAM|nr:hypothetical protein EVG20_g4124 [Dentipellis fragilis]
MSLPQSPLATMLTRISYTEDRALSTYTCVFSAEYSGSSGSRGHGHNFRTGGAGRGEETSEEDEDVRNLKLSLKEMGQRVARLEQGLGQVNGELTWVWFVVTLITIYTIIDMFVVIYLGREVAAERKRRLLPCRSFDPKLPPGIPPTHPTQPEIPAARARRATGTFLPYLIAPTPRRALPRRPRPLLVVWAPPPAAVVPHSVVNVLSIMIRCIWQRMPSVPTASPSFADIREKTEAVFGKRPCQLQVKICSAILQGKKNVVCCASTGFGKTLTFMMPLLFAESGIMIVVSALNILGTQMVNILAPVGISAIAVTAKNDNDATFKQIREGRHRLVIVGPEILMRRHGHFERLWKDKAFVARLMPIVFDEGHCISQWSAFRPQYKDVGRLRYLLPLSVCFYVTSATLSPPVMEDISLILHLRHTNTHFFLHPNDCPNVFMTVQKMAYPSSSFRDLDFLVPTDGSLPPKFLVFFDNIKQAELCCKHLRTLVPKDEDADRMIWYHSIMSDQYREAEAVMIGEGTRSGALTTTSFGLGMDLSDILLIVQWKVTCDMESLWQRFGRGARDPMKEAVGILFAEPKNFVAERKKAEVRAELRVQKKENASQEMTGTQTTSKRKKRKPAPVNGESTTQGMFPAKRHCGPTRSDASSSRLAALNTNIRLPSTMIPLPSSQVSQDRDRPPIMAGVQGPLPTPALPAAIAEQTPSPTRSPAAQAMSHERLCRRYHEKPAATTSKVSQARQLELDPVMDDFINAREPCDHEHTDCRPDLPDGCSRCRSWPSRLCCDLCTPSLLEEMGITLTAASESQPATVHRSNIRKREESEHDRTFKCRLHEWRTMTAKEVLPWGVYKDFGPRFFLSDELIDRITLCAGARKLVTGADVFKETRWALADTHSAAILAIVKDVFQTPTDAEGRDTTTAYCMWRVWSNWPQL